MMSKSHLDRQLRYFVSIVKYKTITQAAKQLDISQSGLSKHLALLEKKLGRDLFYRTGRGVQLTAAGESLYQSVQPAFETIDQSVENIKDLGNTWEIINLAVVHTLSYYFLSQAVTQYCAHHPRVTLSFLGRSSPEVVQLVERGQVDIGLVYDVAVNTDQLTSMPLFYDDMVLVVPQDSSLKGPQDLRDMPIRLVAFPPEYALRKMLQTARLTPQVVAEVETIAAMLELVSSGLGKCILPSKIPDKLLSKYDLIKLPIDYPKMARKVVAVVNKDKEITALTRHFLNTLAAVAKEQ